MYCLFSGITQAFISATLCPRGALELVFGSGGLRHLKKCRFSRSIFPVWHPAELTLVGVCGAPAHSSGKEKLNNQILGLVFPKQCLQVLLELLFFANTACSALSSNTYTHNIPQNNILNYMFMSYGILHFLLLFFLDLAKQDVPVCVSSE